jgi:hypothetical protein
MEFITNQKGNKSLLWNGSRFTVNRKMDNGTIYWRCCKRSCPARVITQGSELLAQTNGHNHPVDPTEVRVEEIKSNLRKSVRELTPVPRIYNEALIELSTQEDRDSVAAQLPMFSLLKSSLYHHSLRSERRYRLMMSSLILLMVTGSFVVLKVLETRSCSLPLTTTCVT